MATICRRWLAFGVYDWTQGNAIEVLIRLAAEGVERDVTVARLKRALPDIRDEALHYAFAPLVQRGRNADVDSIIKELAEDFEYLQGELEDMWGDQWPIWAVSVHILGECERPDLSKAMTDAMAERLGGEGFGPRLAVAFWSEKRDCFSGPDARPWRLFPF